MSPSVFSRPSWHSPTHATRSGTRDATAWNVLGILDLVVAITTGFITSPSTLFSYEPPNELIAIFPMVLIPVYLVPLSLLPHLASLAKLHGWLAYRGKIATARHTIARPLGCSTHR